MMDGFVENAGPTSSVVLEIHDPTGSIEVAQSHAPRIDGLNGKVIAELSNGSWEAHRTFPVLRELLQKRFPEARIIPFTEFPRGTGNVDQDSTADLLVERGIDAVIVGNAACGSCSTAAGRAAAKAEKRGIPATIITRQGFAPIVDYAFGGLGFSAESAKHSFPMKMFLADGDLSLMEAGLDSLLAGLTDWQPKAARTTTVAPPRISVEGEGYQDAIDRVNALFLTNLWSDGLPIVPPTEERVAWLMTGTDQPRNRILGKILPRGGIVTIETIAVAAAMAGCRPEYMPVLVAAMEAMLEPAFAHQLMQTTTGTNHPVVVVNGAMARQIRLNSGYGCLGPSSVYPAGASIGRAVRFLLTNVGGAIPGTGTMSIHGTPGKYTGTAFAEDEAGLPEDWSSLAAERGAAEGTNAVTVISCSSSVQLWNGAAVSEKEVALCLGNYAACIGTQHGAYFSNAFNRDGVAGILLIARASARYFAELGWTKARIKEFLWENSKLPESDWLKEIVDYFGVRKQLPIKDHIRYPMPIAMAPENMMIVVAGGETANHAFWFQIGAGIAPVTRGVTLPAQWERLLEKAESALGPIPAA